MILLGTVGLLRDALNLLLDAVPAQVDPTAVAAYLASLEDVTAVHDLHIWSMSTTEVAMTAHLVMRTQPGPGVPSRDRDRATPARDRAIQTELVTTDCTHCE